MTNVVKIGGNVVDNEQMLDAFCRDFAAMKGPKVLVHGGGVLATKMQEAMGIKAVKIQGRRVTDEQTLRIVTMVYSGWCNKSIVALLQKYGCNAIGLSGCDASVIKASRRPPIDIDGQMVDFGYVGDVNAGSVNADFLNKLLETGCTPVLCAINHDGQGQLLNTNADTMASSVATALKAQLTICFEKKGVLMDKDDDSSVISHIDTAYYKELRDKGVIADGMIPKLDNSFKALGEGAGKVCIRLASDLLDDNAGTTLTL